MRALVLLLPAAAGAERASEVTCRDALVPLDGFLKIKSDGWRGD